MSYICKNCGTAKIAGSKPNKVVVETRESYYDFFGVGTVGREIVKEVNLCDVCYTKWMKEHPIKRSRTVEETVELLKTNFPNVRRL